MPSLFSSELRRTRKKLMDVFIDKQRTQQNVATMPFRNQAGGYGFMGGGESRPSTAAEMGAENERRKTRALYGKYGKGGLEREKLRSTEGIRAAMEAGMTKRAGMEIGGRKEVTGMQVTGRETVAGKQITGRKEVETSRRTGFDLRTKAAYGKGSPSKIQADAAMITAKKPVVPKVYETPVMGIAGQKLSSRSWTMQKDPITGQMMQVPVTAPGTRKAKAGWGKLSDEEKKKRWKKRQKQNALRIQ